MPLEIRSDQRSRGRRVASACPRPPRGSDDSAAAPPLPSVQWFAAVRRAALRWFARHGRDLPWRRSNDAYAVLVSELMLQQTTVATVAPRWQRFLAMFPTVEHLARADESEVLRAWEGLGYYRRAKQLHAAAQRIVADHAGNVPDDPATLAELPGLGRYSASAVLCFARGRSLPIVEANTRRLWARLLGFRAEANSPEADRMFWAAAERIVRRSRSPRQINLALMDLGALVCRPRQPQCDRCPLVAHCAAWAQGLQKELPRKRTPVVLQPRHEAAVVIHRGSKVLLVRYGETGQWSGLWDFPRVLLTDHCDPPTAETVGKQVDELLDCLLGERTDDCRQSDGDRRSDRPARRIVVERHLARWNHRVTRFQITLECFTAQWIADERAERSVADSLNERAAAEDAALYAGTHSGRDERLSLGHPCAMAWVEREALADYPLPSTARRLARLYFSAERREIPGKSNESSPIAAAKRATASDRRQRGS